MKAKPTLIAAVAIALLASGCQNPFAKKYAWTEEAVLKRGWIAPRHIHVDRIYCYRTLADRECYAEPLEGAATRFVGSFGRLPQ